MRTTLKKEDVKVGDLVTHKSTGDIMLVVVGVSSLKTNNRISCRWLNRNFNVRSETFDLEELEK